MQNRAAHFGKTPEAIRAVSAPDLAKLTRSWLLDGELSNRSHKTLKSRREILGKLQWFLEQRDLDECGVPELRAFFLYLQNGHKDPGGRWGNPTETKPLKPLSFKTYYVYLRAFFNFAVAEGELDASPMERIPAPRDPGDDVQPFTDAEAEALIRAAERTRQGVRDAAIVYTLLDTGIRASELCGLIYSDVDFTERSLRIREGKGKKSRWAYLGKRATRALWKYVQLDGRDPDDPLIFSERGEALTYNGLRLLIGRLGKVAGVKKCHAHRFRHMFAVSFLKAGGNQFSLMRLLGHTTLTVTNRYVQLAQADVQAQHRAFSPGDRLKGRN